MGELNLLDENLKNLKEKLDRQFQEIDKQKREIEEKNKIIGSQKNQLNDYGVFIDDLIKMLLHLLELRDPYTLGHSVRVARIAKLIAEESKVKIDIKKLQYACFTS